MLNIKQFQSLFTLCLAVSLWTTPCYATVASTTPIPPIQCAHGSVYMWSEGQCVPTNEGSAEPSIVGLNNTLFLYTDDLVLLGFPDPTDSDAVPLSFRSVNNMLTIIHQLQADLVAERSMRVGADTALQQAIDAQSSQAVSFSTALATLSSLFTAAAAQELAADLSLSSNIAFEASRATQQESSIANALTLSTTQELAADLSLSSNIAVELSRATQIEASLAGVLFSVTSSALTTSQSLAQSVDAANAASNTAASLLTLSLAQEV